MFRKFLYSDFDFKIVILKCVNECVVRVKKNFWNPLLKNKCLVCSEKQRKKINKR